MSNPTPTPTPPPTSSSSHHKSKQNLHHSNNQALQHNKNSGPNHQSSMKKNVRAWGNINNPNNNNNNNNNHNNNNNNNHPQSAWRNNNNHQSHHYVNGAIVGQSNNQNTHSNQFQQAAIPNDEKLVLKAMHERMVWFIMSLVGYTVTATTKSGQRFQGLLSSAVTESEFSITLKRAVQLPIPSTSSSTPTPRSAPVVKSTLIIFSRELVEVVATDVDLNQASSVGTGSNAGFKTDSETLGTKLDANGQPIIREKELQTWQPTPGDMSIEPTNPTANLNESDPIGLEDSLFPKNSDHRRTFDKPWDQFEANEKLFGTRTDFDEEIYTTKLDRSGKDFKERERKAEALAREIMGSSTSNPHVQEERGLLVADDSGMNEEDKYGAVIRSEGAYVPPGARKAAAAAGGNKQTLQPSASNSNLNKSGSSSQPQNATNNNNPSRTSKAATDGQPAGMNANLPATNSGPRQPNKATATVSGTSGEKPTIDPPANFSSKPIPIVNVPSHLNSTAGSNLISKSSSAQPAIKVALSNRPSKQPDEVAPRFKAFVTDEKERLQQKKKDLLKKEKESRLAEFRAFSMSFKLPMAVPKDLEPIIKKPVNSTSTGANPQAVSTSSKPTEQDDAGRRASVVAANAQLNRAQPNPRVNMLPSNLQITTNSLGQDLKRVSNNTTSKPPISNAGLKAMVALAAIPPFKPRNPPSDPHRNVTGPTGMSKKGDQQKGPPRFAVIPPIPPFKPKGSQPTGSNDNSKLSTKAAAFNPAAKTFTPGPPGQPVGPSSSNRKPLQHVDPNMAGSVTNPFFGSKPIKKGSSSMHVKEEFTPFKSSSVPEASHVGPAWNFSGKSYRQMFGPNAPPPLPPQPHPVQQIVPHMMHHQHHPAAQQQQQQQQHQQQIHHHAPHQQPHGPSHAHHHSQSGPPNNMMPAPIPPPMHLPPHATGGPPHHHHNPIGMPEEEGNGGGPGGGMVVTMGYGPPLPPPIPPYLYHHQPQPQQPQPQSPYNGSYRNNGGANNGGFGPPVQGFNNGPNNGAYYAGSPNGGNSANGSLPPQHFSPHGPPVPGLPPPQQQPPPPQQMYQGPPPPHHQMFQGGHPVPPGPGPGPGGRGVPMYAYGPNMGFGPPPPGYGGTNGGGNGNTGSSMVGNANGPNGPNHGNGNGNGNGQFDQGGQGGGPPPPPPTAQ